MQKLQETLPVIFLIREEGFVSMFGGNHEGMCVFKVFKSYHFDIERC
jgi:hypothetical protein